MGLHSASTIQKAERKIVVDYSIDKVKEAILLVFENRRGKYIKREDSINDVFNTYHFPASNGLNPAIIDMTLNVVEENKTEITIAVTNTFGAVSSNSILGGVLQDYLNVLGAALQGGASAIPKGSGCVVSILILIAALGLMSFMIF